MQEMSGDINYKTHILIGVRANGVMTVIADWPHLPKQAEVQEEIDGAPNGYVTFLLCTPTSILPAVGNGDSVTKDKSHGSRRRR
jgi:hypothetical protein